MKIDIPKELIREWVRKDMEALEFEYQVLSGKIPMPASWCATIRIPLRLNKWQS